MRVGLATGIVTDYMITNRIVPKMACNIVFWCRSEQVVDMIKNLAVLAVLAWIGWYAYSQLKPMPTVEDRAVEGASFNCRACHFCQRQQ